MNVVELLLVLLLGSFFATKNVQIFYRIYNKIFHGFSEYKIPTHHGGIDRNVYINR